MESRKKNPKILLSLVILIVHAFRMLTHMDKIGGDVSANMSIRGH
jgi:hypothetical protein